MKTINGSTNTKRSRRIGNIRLMGYIAVALIAVQPFLELQVNTGNRFEVARYIFRIVLTVLIAILGKFLKERETVEGAAK